MKVTQASKKFQPVTIVLESRDDARHFWVNMARAMVNRGGNDDATAVQAMFLLNTLRTALDATVE